MILFGKIRKHRICEIQSGKGAGMENIQLQYGEPFDAYVHKSSFKMC